MSKQAATEHGRGEIRDNALKALVTSKLFQPRVVKAKRAKARTTVKGVIRKITPLLFLIC